MQTAPPFSPEPYCLYSGFINTVSFNSLIPDLGSLPKIQLFPWRLLEREENRCSTTDITFNKPRRPTLCVYIAFITCPQFLWALELPSLTNLRKMRFEREKQSQQVCTQGSWGTRSKRQMTGLCKLLWIFSCPCSRQVALQRASSMHESPGRPVPLSESHLHPPCKNSRPQCIEGAIRCLTLCQTSSTELGSGSIWANSKQFLP